MDYYSAKASTKKSRKKRRFTDSSDEEDDDYGTMNRLAQSEKWIEKLPTSLIPSSLIPSYIALGNWNRLN